MNNRLQLEEEDSIEEQKYFTSPFFLPSGFHERLKISPNFKSENMDQLWPEEKMHESLLMRRKEKHLSEVQIIHVVGRLKRCPESRNHLQKIYELSRTTMRRIARQMNASNSNKVSKILRLKSQITISNKAKLLTRSYLLPPCSSKSLPMVKKYIESELNEVYSLRKIRNFVKKEMNYAYKRVIQDPQFMLHNGLS